MKTYGCDKIRIDQVVLQRSGEGWILIINYAVGIYTEGIPKDPEDPESVEIPESFDSIKRYSKSFALSSEEQTSIKSFLSSKIAEIKTQEDIDEIIY